MERRQRAREAILRKEEAEIPESPSFSQTQVTCASQHQSPLLINVNNTSLLVKPPTRAEAGREAVERRGSAFGTPVTQDEDEGGSMGKKDVDQVGDVGAHGEVGQTGEWSNHGQGREGLEGRFMYASTPKSRDHHTSRTGFNSSGAHSSAIAQPRRLQDDFESGVDKEKVKSRAGNQKGITWDDRVSSNTDHPPLAGFLNMRPDKEEDGSSQEVEDSAEEMEEEEEEEEEIGKGGEKGRRKQVGKLSASSTKGGAVVKGHSQQTRSIKASSLGKRKAHGGPLEGELFRSSSQYDLNAGARAARSRQGEETVVGKVV